MLKISIIALLVINIVVNGVFAWAANFYTIQSHTDTGKNMVFKKEEFAGLSFDEVTEVTVVINKELNKTRIETESKFQENYLYALVAYSFSIIISTLVIGFMFYDYRSNKQRNADSGAIAPPPVR